MVMFNFLLKVNLLIAWLQKHKKKQQKKQNNLVVGVSHGV